MPLARRPELRPLEKIHDGKSMIGSILPPALSLLLRMQVRGRLRKVARGGRTVKGKLYLCLMLVMFALWLGPTVGSAVFMPRPDANYVRSFLSPGLLTFCLLTLITTGPESGIYFAAADVDLLFPAPFRRRDLLLYRLAGLGMGVLFTALMFSLLLLQHVRYWLFGFYGICLALAFIQLVPIALTLVISIVGQRVYTRGRRLALGVAGVFLAVAATQIASQHLDASAIEYVKQFRSTTIGKFLLAAFGVFSRTITAETVFPDFLGWGALALTMDAALVGVVLGLDANFLESSIAASQKLYQKIERLQRGQMWMNLSKPSGAGWRLPVLPRWRGAGPIAWRQLVSAVRGSRGMVYFLLTIVVAMTLPALFIAREEPGILIAMAIGVMPMLSFFLLPQLLQFDFRGDLERIDVLKTLPFSPSAIVAGELITPIVFATLFELPLAVGIALFQEQWLLIVVAALALVPAVNLFVFAFENLVFLWFPCRLANLGAGDFQAFGRQMLVMFLKFVMVMLAGSLAAGAGALAWLASESWPAAVAAGWCVIMSFGLGLIPLVAIAFRNFDPSLDTPD